jgi:hypothetical protein
MAMAGFWGLWFNGRLDIAAPGEAAGEHAQEHGDEEHDGRKGRKHDDDD